MLLSVIQNAKEAILLRHPANPFVDIACTHKDGFTRITVRDNGGGIPSEIMDKIFDPYFTSKFKSQGAGMGLYMSKLIIEKHMSGKISVANTADGTEVAIELPLDQTHAAASG